MDCILSNICFGTIVDLYSLAGGGGGVILGKIVTGKAISYQQWKTECWKTDCLNFIGYRFLEKVHRANIISCFSNIKFSF